MKKLLTLIALTIFPLSNVFAFTDTYNSPNKQAIEYLQNTKIINGYADNTYKPDQPVNRAEFLKILIATKFSNNQIEIGIKNCFSDVTDQWFAKYICLAKSNNIVDGYPDTTFRPANNINLAEALKIILETYEIQVEHNPQLAWYEPYYLKAKENHLMGNINTIVDHSLTRGEMAQMMYTLMNYSTITYADKLKTCTKYKTTFLHILTKQGMEREILGLIDGKCNFVEEMPNNGKMTCTLDQEQQLAFAKYYNDFANAQSYSLNIHLESDPASQESTEKIDGVEIINPMQAAFDNGSCVISGY